MIFKARFFLFIHSFFFLSSFLLAQENPSSILVTPEQLLQGFTFEISSSELLLKENQKVFLDLWIKPLKPNLPPYVVRSSGDLTGIKPFIEQDPHDKNHIRLAFQAPLSLLSQNRQLKILLGVNKSFEKKDLTLIINPKNVI